MKVRELIKRIEKDGWYQVAQKGSHIQYKHSEKPDRVTIPYHGSNKEVAKGTVNSVLKQAKLK